MGSSPTRVVVYGGELELIHHMKPGSPVLEPHGSTHSSTSHQVSYIESSRLHNELVLKDVISSFTAMKDTKVDQFTFKRGNQPLLIVFNVTRVQTVEVSLRRFTSVTKLESSTDTNPGFNMFLHL